MSDIIIICSIYGAYILFKIYFYFQDFTNKEAYSQFKGIFTKSFTDTYEIVDQRFYKWVYTYSFIRDFILLIFAGYNILYRPTIDFCSYGIGGLVFISLIFEHVVCNKFLDKQILKYRK